MATYVADIRVYLDVENQDEADDALDAIGQVADSFEILNHPALVESPAEAETEG